MGAAGKTGIEMNGADWGFAQDREWYLEFTEKVGAWARRYGVDPDDMVQQATMWAAGHPGVEKLLPAQAARRSRSVNRSLISKEVLQPDVKGQRETPDHAPTVDLMLALEEFLAPKELEAVTLRLVGFTQKEIGCRLGISPTAVRMRLNTARERLVDSDLLSR